MIILYAQSLNYFCTETFLKYISPEESYAVGSPALCVKCKFVYLCSCVSMRESIHEHQCKCMCCCVHSQGLFFYKKLTLGATLAITSSCILPRLLHNSGLLPLFSTTHKNKIVNRLCFRSLLIETSYL